MSRPTNPAGYPYVRLASVALRIPPEEGPPEFTLALDSVNSGTGSLSSDPWSQTAAVGNRYEPGDVLFGKLRPYLAKVWVADRIGNYVGDFMRIVPRDSFDSNFLKYVFLTPEFISKATAESVGSKMPRTEWDALKDLQIPSPTRVQQQQIADYLDHETAEIDAFITELNDLKSLLLIRRRTTIDDAFESTRAPAVALKYLGELNSGLTLGKKYEGPTQEFPYLRVANVQAGRVDLKNITTVSVPLTVAANSLLRVGDVLMTEGGDRDKLGRGALWQGEIDRILHQNHIFSFRCNSKLLPEYLVYGLESTPARIYFDHTARQSTNLASTNSAIVKNFRLPAPSVGTQEKVLDHLHHELTEMQEMLSNADRVIDLARERRAALITAAVTGQIDVTAKNRPAAEQLEDDIAHGLHKES